MKHIKSFFTLGILLFPITTFAAFEGIKNLLNEFGGMLNGIIRIIFGLSLIFFFWGVSQFILNAGDAKLREEGKKKMLWGIIALFVFLSIYGIIGFIGNALGISQNGSNANVSTEEVYQLPTAQ